MFAEIDVLGAFVPAIAAWLVGSLVIFVLADALLTKAGFYRLFWHKPLARLALFICFFCGGRSDLEHELIEREPMPATIRVLLTLVVVSAAVVLGYDIASYYLYSPWTRDARIRADVVAVAPDVQGYITDLRVRNDQFVRKGDILFVIDQERYKLELEVAEAAVVESTASRELARLNLKRTEVRAAVNGFVTNLNFAQGTYASPSKPVLALIDSDSYSVDAYFEETKIPQIKIGSPVDIRLLNGSPALQGKVEALLEASPTTTTATGLNC
jgi:multidrug resistance efflux pump